VIVRIGSRERVKHYTKNSRYCRWRFRPSRHSLAIGEYGKGCQSITNRQNFLYEWRLRCSSWSGRCAGFDWHMRQEMRHYEPYNDGKWILPHGCKLTNTWNSGPGTLSLDLCQWKIMQIGRFTPNLLVVGHDEQQAFFSMEEGFYVHAGADGWQVANSNILVWQLHQAFFGYFKRRNLKSALKSWNILTGILRILNPRINGDFGSWKYLPDQKSQPKEASQLIFTTSVDAKAVLDELL